MSYLNSHISRRAQGGVLTVLLNRPDRLNAMDQVMRRHFVEVLRAAAEDSEVRVIVVTGAGRAFCAGGDQKPGSGLDLDDPQFPSAGGDPQNEDETLQIARLRRDCEGPYLLYTMPKPTIAMIRGPVAGAGLSIAAACDFRVASETASFTTAFSRIGYSGDHGGSYYLTNLIGPAATKRLYFLSEKLGAEEALRIGLIDEIVEDKSLETETEALAMRLVAGPPLAYGYIKENVNAALTEPLSEVLDRETRNHLRTVRSADGAEGRRAFREKSEPAFRGR